MDGLLVIDKPAGPTSHDIVARMRRALREKSIGHAGTLDPMATGVLLLVLGRATRLAKFISASDKSYDAVVRLGFATDAGDALGVAVGPVSRGPWPAREAVDAALTEFRGAFLQQPPAFSAKRIDGTRSYKLARRARRSDPEAVSATLPDPVSVNVSHLKIVSLEADRVTLSLDCSAGFYVRSLAHDLGARLGLGGHLASLRRTRSGDFSLDQAISLDVAERDPAHAIAQVITPARMLPGLAAVVLTPEGVRRARHGRDLGPGDMTRPTKADAASGISCRLLDPEGELVGIGVPAALPGLLHPSVVLG